jgi:hypothetical protein
MKKRYWVIIVLAIFGLVIWGLSGISDTQVVAPTDDKKDEPIIEKASKENIIYIDSPYINQKVSSPVTVKGKARGNWFFEASAPVDIVNWDGLIIGEGYMTVDEGYNWMTTDLVPFTGTIKYDASQLGAYDYGWVIFKKDNPSGESKFDDSLEMRVLLK